MKVKKVLLLVLATTVFLCSVLALSAMAYETQHVHEEIQSRMIDPCCSNPKIDVYKKDHQKAPTGNYCTCTIVEVCNNCGFVLYSPATSTHGCADWCYYPEWNQ